MADHGEQAHAEGDLDAHSDFKVLLLASAVLVLAVAWKTPPRLSEPRCARVAAGNSITLDRDVIWGFAVAADAVRTRYADRLDLLEVDGLAYVRYPTSDTTFQFKLKQVDPQTRSLTLSLPRFITGADPCQSASTQGQLQQRPRAGS